MTSANMHFQCNHAQVLRDNMDPQSAVKRPEHELLQACVTEKHPEKLLVPKFDTTHSPPQ